MIAVVIMATILFLGLMLLIYKLARLEEETKQHASTSQLGITKNILRRLQKLEQQIINLEKDKQNG